MLTYFYIYDGSSAQSLMFESPLAKLNVSMRSFFSNSSKMSSPPTNNRLDNSLALASIPNLEKLTLDGLLHSFSSF